MGRSQELPGSDTSSAFAKKCAPALCRGDTELDDDDDDILDLPPFESFASRPTPFSTSSTMSDRQKDACASVTCGGAGLFCVAPCACVRIDEAIPRHMPPRRWSGGMTSTYP